MFERKVNGPIMKEFWGEGGLKYNEYIYIYMLVKHTDTVRSIRAQRIRWVGHIVRTDKEKRMKRIIE